MTSWQRPGRHVWTTDYSDVFIIREDEEGNLINADGGAYVEGVDKPLITYAYLEGIVISGTVTAERRPVTHRRTRKIVRLSDFEFSATIDSLYILRSEQHQTNYVFNREQRMRFRMFFTLYDIAYHAFGPAKDYHTLKTCYATDWSIKGQDKANIIYTAQLMAEEFAVEGVPQQ